VTTNVATAGVGANTADVDWLDLDAVADVTISAQGKRLAGAHSRWSADCQGEQMIEIRFRQPIAVRRLRVISTEADQFRTQEMTVWACVHRGERHHDVVRQQFNFSPNGAAEEIEEYVLAA
jgi:hypothetical protein